MSAKKTAYIMTLQDLLITKLQVLYDVENQLVKALPKMAKNASDSDLSASFEEHLKQTKGHVERLEKAFKLLDIKPKKMKSEAIRGLVEDAEWVIENVQGDEALDANLIAAAQYVEHYEIAGYGSAQSWASEMGHAEVSDLLQETLDEEKAADKKLNDLATSKINEKALPDSE